MQRAIDTLHLGWIVFCALAGLAIGAMAGWPAGGIMGAIAGALLGAAIGAFIGLCGELAIHVVIAVLKALT